jgi:2-polyprenyl-3-methyl-5-hydroxy-6-metoxy-1,4-benzoquinol methylase
VNDMVTDEMRETYDKYFLSNGYTDRYPVPNPATLDYILRHGARRATHILDFGCGDGRYALALLARTGARLTGYDISRPSLQALERSLQGTPYRERVTLVGGDIDNLAQSSKFDLVLMLFGVLSHVGNRATRIDTLRRLRERMSPGAQLILSVPSIYRRRPLDLCRYACARQLGRARPPQHEAGNIYFVRQVHGERLRFFYHLYTVARLSDELRAAGFALQDPEAESVFPEWWLMRSRRLQSMDRKLSRWIAASLGYGIRARAECA